MNTPAKKVARPFELNNLYTLRPIIRDELTTIKNHIASRVEAGQFEAAKSLVERLRETEACYKLVNASIHDITGNYE